jgi:type III pantothenate kinase
MNMFIAIDIGNTSTVVGIYKNASLLAVRRLTSTEQITEAEIFARIRSLLVKAGTNKKRIDGIGISSVVPNLTKVYAATAKNYFHQDPLIVSSELDLGIKIHYDNPKSLGADRICNARAGYSRYGGPLIIIDFGTATTYDVIASNGDFLGGVIAPGIETSAISLQSRTSKLPRLAGTKIRFPKTAVGTNTASSIQSGILWGALDSMTGMVDRIQKELRSRRSKTALVIATGGFSTLMAEQTRIIQHVEPMLVLEGIRLISDRVKMKKGK